VGGQNPEGATGLGLPFSDTKFFPWYTEQDGTDGSSVGIPPVSQERKTSKFRSKLFLGREKPSEFRYEPFVGREKPSEFHFGRKKLRDSVLNHLQMRKKFRILFRIISGRGKLRKKSTFC
jgi:hypothetical protein